MQLASRLAFVTACVIIAITAACGSDSTGPGDGGTSPPSLTKHFDSLYVTAKAKSASDTMFKFRSVALSDLELPSAFGATPSAITVTTASGTETWHGFVFEEVLTDHGTPSDSGRFVLAYRDADAHTIFVTTLKANGTSVGASLVANDTVIVHASSNAGSVTLLSTGAACAAPPSGLTNPVIATAQTSTCLLANFSATLTLTFPATAGVDAALTQLSFPATNFAGVRFLDPFTATATSRVSHDWQRAPLAQ
ncbi:MAG TPA: hypothetical protein VGO46_03035 [Gemmatimonadaceae bacterium]|jgi:hypothetical protein|nr:hypothetical protein [Gemmatimonadaceae bacterium]